MSSRSNKYEQSITRLVACRIKLTRATDPHERVRYAGAVRHATQTAIGEWLKTGTGKEALVRYATAPNLLYAEAVAQVLAEVRSAKKQPFKHSIKKQQTKKPTGTKGNTKDNKKKPTKRKAVK